MSEEFNWLDYAEPEESAPAPSPRRGLRRFLPRRPRLPRLPGRPRLPGLPGMPRLPRLPRLSLPRRGSEDSSLETPSAPDLLGLQDERPLEELDEGLRSLRERSAAGAQFEVESRQALYDVDEVLVSPEVLQKPGGVISAAALSKAQEQQVEMLKDIVGGAGQAEETGGRRFLPSAAFSLSAAPRLLGSAVLCLMVSLPFVSSDFSEGQLPPSEFHEDRPGATTVYDLLDNLTVDDYVLVAFEYGPAAAGELDAIADLFLRHIVAQRAKPLIVSSNPIAIVHAQNIIRGINRSVASSGNDLQRGRDYFILRYLPGGSLGLRELSENFADVARVSHKGELTGLDFDSLEDLAAIVLVAERAEDMRNWAEQVVAEVADTRLLAASGYAAAPLAQVYADSMEEIVGLVVGYRDAYTYGEKLENNYGDPLPAALEPDARTDAPEVEAAVEPAAQEEQTSEADAQLELAQATATEKPPATEMPSPTVRSLPTTTPRPSNTAPPTATDPPTATATQETVRVVEIVSPQQVRIRRGPSTASDILQLALAGDMFELIGANGDDSWYRIALSAGLEGWIAEFLVEVKEATRAALQAAQASASARISDERVFLRREFNVSLGKNRPRYYQVNTPISGDIPEYVLLRDRSQEVPRLNAMTFGTLAAVLVIALGNVYYALGALGRRRAADKA